MISRFGWSVHHSSPLYAHSPALAQITKKPALSLDSERGDAIACRHGLGLPRACALSTTSVGKGDHRVRNGNGSNLAARHTDKRRSCRASSPSQLQRKSAWPISTHSLQPLLAVHGPPIHPVVCRGSSPAPKGADWISHLGAGFALRCVQRFSVPDLASQRCAWQHNWAHQRSVHSGPLVLGAAPLKYPPLTTERDRTVSRRSEPSSRTALMGEQPNPWDRLQPQDAMSRHRGAKPSRRYGLLGKISLLSPG